MKDLIYGYALMNAIEHNGKANVNAVLGKLIAEDSSLKDRIQEVITEIKEVVRDVNSMSLDEQEKMVKKFGVKTKEKPVEEIELHALPNATKGKVVMRLAPYPSGPLHIGNARMVILNDEYVKRYKGKLLLVFDDTIGSEEKFILPQAYKMIADGLEWLEIKYHKSFYKSHRMKLFYEIAEHLIKRDAAYVCECDTETLRKNRAGGVSCAHREQDDKTNLQKWKKMLQGKYKEGKAIVRLKTDMNHPNPAFRDRVLLRVSERKHPKVGKKYKVWPMLEFSWAVDDHFLGMTHILRGKDLVIEDMMEEYIWDIMGWKKPEILHYGILNLQGVKLSKTESRKLIEKKTFKGWDDPRTWSMQSLQRRGIQPQAIRNFVIKMGMSLADISTPVEILYSENRKLIDSKANRYFCVLDPVMISVKQLGKIKFVTAPLHPDFPKRGRRKIPVDEKKIYIERNDFDNFHGKEVGLMNLFSISLRKNSEKISEDVKFEIPKIHWVSDSNVNVKVVMPDGKEVRCIAETAVKKLKAGELVQFPRIGFARLDKMGKEFTFYFAHK